MTQKDKTQQEEQDILQEMEEELEEIETQEGEIDEEKLEEELHPTEEDSSNATQNQDPLAVQLAKTMADFENFKKRTERDKAETMFFLKAKIFKEVLPTVDDMERIIKNTKPENTDTGIYEGLISSHKKFVKNLQKLWVTSFESIGHEVNPDLHDVMSVVPGKEPGIIFEEFEKGYMLEGKVLRHAKVIVGA